MNEYIVFTYNHETGEETYRQMTEEEVNQRQADILAWQAEEELKTQKATEAATQRQALLERLGITADEARLLLGGN